ncbi:4Fe-4S dicluster domain-containing protein [Haliovirga abyssi]|uniref:4Fe-4S ferredoxin-type domain-containing protein n=1 Tax=Haliovirga abyssi TaxID=2996794 RepID=A0AAU9DV18_9FUSO|nr:4Fe-4S dicluster-binding protein [Haliovirga abyssi]BDU49936.1 hypothetical protein HLVA_05050 [Haliovirga abyssi]
MGKKLPEKFAKWHGVDRTKIPWYPIVDTEKCIGCKLCFVSCGRGVYNFDMKSNKAIVENKFQCLVGCTTCAAICPVEAISFPDKEIVHEIEKEEKILVKIQKIAKEKKIKMDIDKIEKEVLENISKAKISKEYEIAGLIIGKEIFKEIYSEIKDCSVDIVDINIKTSSLRGTIDLDAPTVATFKIISTEMEDITKCEDKIAKLIVKNGIVILKKD